MLEIDNKIVSLDLFKEYFTCELSSCKGFCCVGGNSGAPLEDYEVDMLEEEFEAYKPYMKPAGVQAIEEQGFMVVDTDGEYTTPLIDDAECAYSFEQDGVTLCAVERAWREGAGTFRKPVSCHLYPIRVARFSDGSYGLNYHRWDVCSAARECGRDMGVPVYKALKEPLIRRFGEDFYKALEEADELIKTGAAK